MSQDNRAETMAAKLGAYAQRAGAEPETIVAAYRMAVTLRLDALGDVFHPDLLHPARTALVLIEDTGCTDVNLLAAAALSETEYPDLQVDAGRIRARFGDEVAAAVAAVPQPRDHSDELLELLVMLPRDVALITVAERLDHARHLHFREPAVWPSFFAQIVDAYLPFSGRVNAALEARLARWAAAFERRRLRPAQERLGPLP